MCLAQVLRNCTKVTFTSARLHGNLFLVSLIRTFNYNEQHWEGVMVVGSGQEWEIRTPDLVSMEDSSHIFQV